MLIVCPTRGRGERYEVKLLNENDGCDGACLRCCLEIHSRCYTLTRDVYTVYVGIPTAFWGRGVA